MSRKPSGGSQASNHPALGTLIDGNTLELVEVLGVGGYGVVYRAVEKFSSSPRSYAVKCLVSARGSRRQLHIREITLHQLASAHPSVVTLHRIVEDRDYTYIIMDYAPNDDLFTQILHKCRYLGDDTLIKHVFLQLLDAVQYCHSLGIYHRDLKPENVLCYDRGYRVAITDFGLATTEKLSKEFRTGSIYHMSPECQAGDSGKPIAYSPMHNDIWSLGIILLNLVTGRNPWKSATEDDPTYLAYRREPSRFLPSVLPISEELNSLLVQTLRVSWSERLSLKKLREGVESINTFYSGNVIFEGSLARCPWEAGMDLGNGTTPETVDKRPVPNIPEGVEPYCVFSMSAAASGFKSQASGMDEYAEMSRWDEDARYNMRHNGIYDDDGMHTPYDTRSGHSSFSSDHSSPRTPSSTNATGYRNYDLASAYNTYDGQRYYDAKSAIYPTAGSSVEDIDDNRFASSVFLATPVAESKQFFRHPESTYMDGYCMHKRYSSPNTSVYAVAESPLRSKFSDDSEPDASYDDDDHDDGGSESFPPSSPNFAVWPEPTSAPRTGSRPIEIQGARGGQPTASKVKPRSIFNPLRFFPLSNGSSWLNPKESSLANHPPGRSSAGTRVHPAGPTSAPWVGYGHQQPRPVANPVHYMPRGHAANTHWS